MSTQVKTGPYVRHEQLRDAFLSGASWTIVRQQQTLTKEMVEAEAARRYPAPEAKP